jgi:hypothetical protein
MKKLVHKIRIGGQTNTYHNLEQFQAEVLSTIDNMEPFVTADPNRRVAFELEISWE